MSVYAGANTTRLDDISAKTQVIYGMRYILPLLIEAQLEVDDKNDMQLELSSRLQLTDRLVFNWQLDTDNAGEVQLNYEVTKQFLLSVNYDAEFSKGAGVTYRF